MSVLGDACPAARPPHREWQGALAAYESASARYSAFIQIRSRVDEARFGGALEREVGEKIIEYMEEVEDLFCDSKILLAMIDAPAPTWDAYRTKAEIAIREGYAEDVAPALVRDANALLAQDTSIAWSAALARFASMKREYDAYYAETFGPAWEAQKAFEENKAFEHDPSKLAALATFSDRLNALQEADGTDHLVPEAVHKEHERLCDVMCDAACRVLDTPAPDLSALRWKLDYLTDGLTRWDGWDGMGQVLADIARLLPSAEAEPIEPPSE